MENEVWKDIEGHEGQYSVSSLGRVLSTKYTNPRYLSPHLKNGYFAVNLYLNSTKSTHYVHRLVAQQFIENPGLRREVNHLDGIRTNNHLSNLEWATRKENSRHAYDSGFCHRTKDTIKLASSQRKRPVLNTETGIYYDSLIEAAKAHEINFKTLSLWLLGRFPNKSKLTYV